MMIATLVAIFFMVFVVACFSLSQTSLADARIPVSFCVAYLSVMALLSHTTSGGFSLQVDWLSAVLLPYEVLAVCVVFILVVRLGVAIASFRDSAWRKTRRRQGCETSDWMRPRQQSGKSDANEEGRRKSRQMEVVDKRHTGGHRNDRRSSFLES